MIIAFVSVVFDKFVFDAVIVLCKSSDLMLYEKFAVQFKIVNRFFCLFVDRFTCVFYFKATPHSCKIPEKVV